MIFFISRYKLTSVERCESECHSCRYCLQVPDGGPLEECVRCGALWCDVCCLEEVSRLVLSRWVSDFTPHEQMRTHHTSTHKHTHTHTHSLSLINTHQLAQSRTLYLKCPPAHWHHRVLTVQSARKASRASSATKRTETCLIIAWSAICRCAGSAHTCSQVCHPRHKLPAHLSVPLSPQTSANARVAHHPSPDQCVSCASICVGSQKRHLISPANIRSSSNLFYCWTLYESRFFILPISHKLLHKHVSTSFPTSFPRSTFLFKLSSSSVQPHFQALFNL